jgi:hypothetical protein
MKDLNKNEFEEYYYYGSLWLHIAYWWRHLGGSAIMAHHSGLRDHYIYCDYDWQLQIILPLLLLLLSSSSPLFFGGCISHATHRHCQSSGTRVSTEYLAVGSFLTTTLEGTKFFFAFVVFLLFEGIWNAVTFSCVT